MIDVVRCVLTYLLGGSVASHDYDCPECSQSSVTQPTWQLLCQALDRALAVRSMIPVLIVLQVLRHTAAGQRKSWLLLSGSHLAHDTQVMLRSTLRHRYIRLSSSPSTAPARHISA